MKSLEERNQEKLNNIVSTKYPTDSRFHDLSGNDFGMLHVNKWIGLAYNGQSIYECTCQCGNTYYTYSGILTRKNRGVISCGCIRQFHMKEISAKTHPIKHGDGHRGKHHRLFDIWGGMRQRCNNPNDRSYPNYGGRGIKVCDEWNNIDTGYIAFKEWALSNGYSSKLTIDRIDVNGNYCPENCRWASDKLQLNNTRRNHYIQIGRYVFSVSIWAEIMGINTRTMFNRIKYGWSDSDVVLTLLGEPPGTYPTVIEVPSKYEIYNKYDEFLELGKCDKFDENSPIGVKILIVNSDDK